MRREDVVKTINNLKGESGHQEVLRIYNAQEKLPRDYKLQEKDPWCAATVSAVFIANGYNDLSECSCIAMVKKAKDLGIWVEDDSFVPQIGDVIMYDWQDNGNGDDVGTPDHVGIVISVTKSKITVREGNKNKTVGNRDVTINGITIRGYITPPYEENTGLKDEQITNIPPIEEKPVKQPQTSSEYEVGKVYTIHVISALNVRKAPSKDAPCVGYSGLTDDGKRHAYQPSGALRNGTRVTCLDVKELDNSTWIKIPSGWICAKERDRIFVK